MKNIPAVRSSCYAFTLILTGMAPIFLLPTVSTAQSHAFGGISTGVIVESDPFLGDYEGLWIDRPGPLKHYPTIAAEVIPRGGGRYQINILPELDQRCPPFFQLTAKADGGTITIDDGPWQATITPDAFTGQGEVKSETARFEMKKVVRLSPTLAQNRRKRRPCCSMAATLINGNRQPVSTMARLTGSWTAI